MIPITGLSTNVALKLVDATRDRQIEALGNAPEHARGIRAFRDRIANIGSAEQLIDDRELYVFVMKAFGLEDQIFGKALVRKILESDLEDRNSLVNRLRDPRFREMFDVLNFGEGGVGNTNVTSAIWRERMVDRYLEAQFIGDQAEQNANVGIALEFRRKAASIENPLDFLKDSDMATFIRRALGLPEAIAQGNIDRQAELIASRLDLSVLRDPVEVEKLVRKFVALSDAFEGQQSISNAAVQLMQGAVNPRGSIAIVSLDIAAINALPRRPYS